MVYEQTRIQENSIELEIQTDHPILASTPDLESINK